MLVCWTAGRGNVGWRVQTDMTLLVGITVLDALCQSQGLGKEGVSGIRILLRLHTFGGPELFVLKWRRVRCSYRRNRLVRSQRTIRIDKLTVKLLRSIRSHVGSRHQGSRLIVALRSCIM